MPKNIKQDHFFIRHATSVALLTLTIVMSFAAAEFYLQKQANNTARSRVIHTYQVTGHIQLLFNRIKDVELGQRGYIIAGDEKYLAPYHDALKDSLGEDAKSTRLEQHHSIGEELTILKQLFSDNPTQEQNLDVLSDYMKELLEYWDATIKLRHHQGNKTLTAFDFHKGNELMANVRSLVSIMMAEENQLLTTRIDADEASTQYNNTLAYCGIAIFYLIMSWSILYYQRSQKIANLMQYALIKKLADSNDLNNAILSSATSLIIAVDRSGTVIVFNKTAEKALGYKASEVIGKHTPALWHDADEVERRAHELSKEYKTIIAANFEVFVHKSKIIGSEVGHWTCIRKDGSRFPARLVTTTLKDENGNIDGYLSVIEDISEIQKANEEREKLVALIEESTDYIGIADLDGNLLYHNRSAKRMLGLADDQDLSKMKITDMHPDWVNQQMQKDAIPHTFKMGSWQGESALLHKNGKEIPVLQNLALHRDANGEPICFTTIMRDITQRKASESQREHLLEKLTESNMELERFAYVASHDMQEPLRMIANFSALLGQEYQTKLDEEGQQYLLLVTESAIRMQDMVSDLLEYARIGNDAARFAITQGSDELKHVLDNLSAAIKEREALITCEILPEIYVNPVQFMRLLQNLIGNGLKYQKDGIKPKVHVGYEDKISEWLFFVRDNGIGMPDEYLLKIFEPYRRLHTWQEYKGTGIGLAVCKKIVENHGGKIWAESEIDKGSVFYFTLPKYIQETL